MNGYLEGLEGIENAGGLFAGAMAAWLATLLTLLCVFIIVVPLWILQAIGLSKMAKNRGIENSWLAWIPIANYYLIGKMLNGKLDLFGKKFDKPELIFPVAMFGLGLLSNIPFIGFLFWLAALALSILVNIQVFRQYRPQKEVLYGVLGAFLIGYFICRNDNYIPPQNDNVQ